MRHGIAAHRPLSRIQEHTQEAEDDGQREVDTQELGFGMECERSCASLPVPLCSMVQDLPKVKSSQIFLGLAHHLTVVPWYILWYGVCCVVVHVGCGVSCVVGCVVLCCGL